MVKFRLPVKDILGLSYYRYELSSTNYMPSLSNTIGIYCTCKTVFGNPVANKSLTLYENGSSLGSTLTNDEGVALWEVRLRDNGLTNFRVGTSQLAVFVDHKSEIGHIHDDRYYTETETDTLLNGKSNTNHTHSTWNSTTVSNGTLYYNTAIRVCALRYSRTFNSGQQNTLYNWGQLFPSNIAYLKPKYMVTGNGNRNGATVTIDSDGIIYGRFQLAFSSETTFYYHLMWHY